MYEKILNVGPEPVRPSGFWETYISASIGDIILKQKSTDAYISKLQFTKFSKQSTQLSEHEIHLNRETFEQFLNKFTFVSVISLKQSKLESRNLREKLKLS